MRIALLTYSTRPRGGVVHTLALAEALAGLGQDVTVVTLGRGGDRSFYRPLDPAVAVQVVPCPDSGPDETVGEKVIRSIDALRRCFDPAGFDVVHAEDCISANAVPGSIRTVHHLDSFTTPQLVRCHERAIVEPRAHVCVSAAVAAELQAGWGIRARVIPNGVDAAPFQRAASADPQASAERDWWRARIGGPYVLAVGGIEPRKGTLDLVEAWPEVVGALPGTKLVIAGGETLFDYREYRVRFEDRCSELGVAPLILGTVEQSKLPALVAGASVFAFPSVKEGFGLAAMEAAAAGVPLVVRELPVFNQVFGRAATYASDSAELATALLGALRSPDPDQIARGRALALRYTWEASARAHLDLYADLVCPAPLAKGMIAGSHRLRR